MLFIEFRLWLEDEETYNKKFKPRALKAAARLQQHPFAHWFPEGGERQALPLRTPAISAASHFLKSTSYISPQDKQVISGLKSLGYEVSDYRQGYVKRGAGVEKIGGLLEKLIRFAKTEEEKEKYRQWQTIFMNSSARKDKNLDEENMWVIVSRNPHDIAQMSYDREWTSCMELEDGAFKNTPFCVIRTGGMVAYLLRKSKEEIEQLVRDTNKYITDPVARMSIKAAANKEKTQTIAVPETRVYPQNVSGFFETVLDWIESHQGDMGSGKFRVLGGYSDDYADSNKIHHRPPRDPDELIKWIKSSITSRQEAAIKMVLDSRREFPPTVYEAIKNVLLRQMNNGYHDYDETDVNKQLLFMWKRFPEMFSDEEKKKLSFFIKDKSDMINRHDRAVADFAKNFKNIINDGKINLPTEGDMKKLQHYLKEIADGKANFTDTASLILLIRHVTKRVNEATNTTNLPLTHYNLVYSHRKELHDTVRVVAENIMTCLLSRPKLSDIADHGRNLLIPVLNLVDAVMSLEITPPTINKIKQILEKLLTEGMNPRSFSRIAYETYKSALIHQSDMYMYEALRDLHEWLHTKINSNNDARLKLPQGENQ